MGSLFFYNLVYGPLSIVIIAMILLSIQHFQFSEVEGTLFFKEILLNLSGFS